MLIPDRLPSLVLLVGAWIPPAAAGWAAAKLTTRSRPAVVYVVLAAFSLAWAAAWYFVQLDRIPPYLPGATEDPSYASPEAVRGLRIVAGLLVLPLSAIAATLALKVRRRSLAAEPGPT
jgi:hypothetical protein